MYRKARLLSLLLLLLLPAVAIARSVPQPLDDSLPFEDVLPGSNEQQQFVEGALPEGESAMDIVLTPPPFDFEEGDGGAAKPAAPAPPSLPEAGPEEVSRQNALASLEEAQSYLQRARVIDASPECKLRLREGDGDLTWSVAMLIESKYNESISRLEAVKKSLAQCTFSLETASSSSSERSLAYLLEQSIFYIDEARKLIASPFGTSPPPPEADDYPKFEGAGARSQSCRSDGTTCQYSLCAKGRKLPSCATGFAGGVTGGARGFSYVVTSSEDDPGHPKPGTFRYGVHLASKRNGGVWITFARSMTVKLRDMVWIRSSTTVDGRGFNIIFTGKCFVLGGVNNVILHNFQISGVPQTDTVHIFGGSRSIWVDHLTSYDAKLGLVSVVQGSRDVTISNCYLSNPNFNMLLGASDADSQDRNMRVTVFRNWFKDSMQRMPHCRWGYCHVVNNYYTNWGYYAIGGRAHAKILSEGNVFVPGRRREVTPWFPGATKGALDQTSSILSKNDLQLHGSTFHQFLLYGKSSLEPKYVSAKHYPPVVPPKKVPKLVQSCSGVLYDQKLQRCLSIG